MTNLMDKDHVRNHPWFKNLKADSAAKEKRIRKHAQSIDLGDSTGKPNLSDMFSSANRLGLLNNSKKLPDLIKTAILTAREVIDQFDFPISPAITYLGVKNVKTAGTTDDVLSGTIVLMCKFATVGGLKQSFDVPVQVVSGKVLPPSVIKFNGRDIVLAQSSVNAMVQRASSYELIPVRKQFSAPLTRDEKEIAADLRNDIGYQAREGIGPVSTIRRTYKKALTEWLDSLKADMPEAEIVETGTRKNEYEVTVDGNRIGYIDTSRNPPYCYTKSGQETDMGGLALYYEMAVEKRGAGVDKESESDLTDKLTPNEPMQDMDEAKKFQNEPLRAKKAKNTLGFEFSSEEDAQEFFDSLEGTEFEGVNAHFMNVGDTIHAYVDQKSLSNPEELQKLYHGFYDELGRRDTSGEDSDIDLNHWAKKAQFEEEDEDYPDMLELLGQYHSSMGDPIYAVSSSWNAGKAVSKELVESAITNLERYENSVEGREKDNLLSLIDYMNSVVSEGDPNFIRGENKDELNRRFYELVRYGGGTIEDVKALLETGQITRSSVDEAMRRAMEDNDVELGDLINDWQKTHKARTASMGTAIPAGYEKVKSLMDKAQEEDKDTFPRSWIHVLRNYILEVVSTASQDAWATHLVNDGYVLNPYGNNNRGRDKTAQVEGEWQEDEVTNASFYPDTKTPIEVGDTVKFLAFGGPVRGNIVEINAEGGNVIIGSKGYEYRVAIEDIQPLPSTFKKMWAESCLRVLPSGKKYAEIFNDLAKNPEIDNPWSATWDARDKDIHSGPKETKNKDNREKVKELVSNPD